MDPNKLDELRAADYKIPQQCGLCEHGQLAPGSSFGTCAVRSYDHVKHGERRSLSVYRGGGCRDLFKLSSTATIELGLWLAFFERTKTAR